MHDAYEPYVKALAPVKVIFLAMGAGVVAFSAIAIWLVDGGLVSPDPGLGRLLLVVLGLLSVGELLAWMVLRRVLVAHLRSRRNAAETPDDRREVLVRALPIQWIIPAAMAESIGLFGVVVLLIGGQWLGLAAPAVMVGILATLWPSPERVGAFIDTIDRDTGTGSL